MTDKKDEDVLRNLTSSDEEPRRVSSAGGLVAPIGGVLRRERELRGISLEEIARSTRIPLRSLQALEDDRWEELPGEVFTRGFLKSYAESLGLDPRPLLARLGQRREGSLQPIATTGPEQRGRRYGIAIALVVLLVLFTLALSVVLRPRRRDVPMELSQVVWPVGVEVMCS